MDDILPRSGLIGGPWENADIIWIAEVFNSLKGPEL
jgi:hypothetical protein